MIARKLLGVITGSFVGRGGGLGWAGGMSAT
ncbi:hypothetical protein GGR96_004087 [Thalassospira tepidiphila]|uniref:Uncharacterized protein n=1 Tax=Thalassospira tepidiphila TaxID=393657 RepID=A0ABX0X5K4_9PROT|nr:hypothetical protein [Thalassospira tepidiphila]